MIIINFHGLGPLNRDIDSGEFSCWLDPPHFESVLDHVMGNDRVLVTFDDGNASDHEIAFPALMKRGMRAVFFVCSGRIGQPGFLNIDQLRALQAGGMTIGSHGVRHKAWRDLGRSELEEEVSGSRKALEEMCGKTVDLAACPFGGYDRRVLSALRNAGYCAVFTSDGGESQNSQWLRPRVTIKRSFTPARIDQLVNERPSAAKRMLHDARILLKCNRPRSLKSLGLT